MYGDGFTYASLKGHVSNWENKDINGDTPLHLALLFSNCHIIHYLVVESACKEVANDDGKLPSDLAHSPQGLSSLRNAQFLFYALKGDMNGVQGMMQNSQVSLEVMDDGGRGVFHYIATSGKEVEGKIIKRMVTQGFDINLRDLDGNTPLHIAAKLGILSTCDSFLDAGALLLPNHSNVKAESYFSTEEMKHNFAALVSFHAAKRCDTRLLADYFYKSNSIIVDEDNTTLLQLILKCIFDLEVENTSGTGMDIENLYRVLSSIVKEDLEIVYNLDNHGRSAAHLASFYGQSRALVIFKESELDLWQRDNDGNTPLHLCITGIKKVLSSLFYNLQHYEAMDVIISSLPMETRYQSINGVERPVIGIATDRLDIHNKEEKGGYSSSIFVGRPQKCFQH